MKTCDHFGVKPGDYVTYDGRRCVVLEVERRDICYPIIYLHDFGCPQAHDWCVGMHADMWHDKIKSGEIVVEPSR